MIRLLKVLIFLGIALSLFSIHIAIAESPSPLKVIEVKPMTPKELVSKYATDYGISESDLLKVITCESKFNPKAWNKLDPNGGSKGILQFQTKTFFSYAKKLEIQNPDIWNTEQQIKVGAYMFSKNQQFQWSCWRSIHEV